MLVTVIIPSYNHHRYVIQAIESVLSQTWPNIDLIVIDDGSTDGSADLITQHHASHGGYRFIAQDNIGLLKTLNKGLSLSRGSFVCELASDDYFPPESIEKRINFLINHQNCIAVFSDGFRVIHGEETLKNLMNKKRKDVLLSSNPIPGMISGRLPIFSTGLIRTFFLKKIGGFDAQTFQYYEDLDTPIYLSLQGQLGYLDEKVIYRREHQTNISTSTLHIRLEKIKLYTKLLSSQEFLPYKKIIKKKLLKSYLALGRTLKSMPDESSYEAKSLLKSGWTYVLRDPKLLWHLMKASL